MNIIKNYLNKKKEEEAKKNHERMVIKSTLMGQIRIPNEFRYVGDSEASSKVVVAPCGHVFSEPIVDRLNQCPDHPGKWEDDKFKSIVSDALSSVVAKFKTKHQDILKTINALKSRKQSKRDPIEEKIKEFNISAATLARRLNEYKSFVKARELMKLKILQAYDNVPEAFNCVVLMDLLEDPVITYCCANVFSRNTLTTMIGNTGNGVCPICRKNFTYADLECRPVESTKLGLEVKSPSSLMGEKIEVRQNVKNLISDYRYQREKLSCMELTDEKLVVAAIGKFNEEVKLLVEKLADYQADMRLIFLREGLIEVCSQMPAEIGNLINMQNPLLGVDGVCYSKTPMNQSDPLFIESPLLSQFRDQYRREYNELLNRIKAVKIDDAAGIRAAIDVFKKNKVVEFSALKRTIYYQNIMHHLKLDRKNVEHLRYWNLQNNPCWHGYGGVEVIHNANEIYRIPTRINKMMDIMSRHADYPTSEAFMLALNNARSSRPSFWNNPLSWFTRSEATNRVYLADNLSRHRLGRLGG